MSEILEEEYPFVAKANAAFEQAAWAVVKRAKETNTPVIIWRDGKSVAVPAEEVEATLRQRGQKF